LTKNVWLIIFKHPSINGGGCHFLIVVLFIFISLTFNCSKQKDPIVAHFGEHSITLDEFRIAYLEALKQPKAIDSRQLRELFLDELINRRLLAEEARRQGLSKNDGLQLQVEAYNNKCLRDEHYQQVIEPRVKIDDDLLSEVYRFTREQRRIKHLFFETKAQADSASKLLQRGASFEALAKIVFKDTSLANSGGDLGWVNWDQMEYDLAMTAFRQDLNAISQPVRSSYGYHILKIVDRKRDPFITEEEFQKDRENISYLLKTKIGEKIASGYIDEMMKGAKVQVRSDALRFVGEKLQQLLSRSPRDTSQVNLTPEEIEPVAVSLWDMRNEPMIFIDDQTITIGQFISNLSYIPRTALKKSYKTVLDYAIRDFKLTQEAKSMGLEKKSATVQFKTNLFEEFRLQIMLRKQIIDSIKITDAEVRQKYSELVADKNLKIPFHEYRDVLARQILAERKANEVPDRIEKLRQGLKIKKNVALIHDYYDSIGH